MPGGTGTIICIGCVVAGIGIGLVSWLYMFAGAKVLFSIAACDVGSIVFAAYHAGLFPDTLDCIVYVDWSSTHGDYTALLGFLTLQLCFLVLCVVRML